MKQNWREIDDIRILVALDRGMTSWEVAKKLESRMEHSKRAIDTRARRLSGKINEKEVC